jgi:hypothetical protein
MTFTQKIGFLLMCLPTLIFGLMGNVVLAGDPQGGPGVQPVTLNNPLQVDSLEALLVAILNIFITLMIPVIVFFIILAGFKYVTAQGNPGRIEEATTTFTYAVIGGVLILAAVAIAEIIRNTVAAF